VIAEAAALWESLSQNHPFIDGNKRTAFAAVYTFLAINGFDLKAEPDETYSFISGLFGTQAFDFAHLETWLRTHVTGR
jgi:death-on-curing protein